MHTTYAALDIMSITNGGSGGILAIISSLAAIDYVPHTPVYTATKYAIIGLTRSFGVKLLFIMNFTVLHISILHLG